MSKCKPNIPDGLAGSTLCLTGFSGYVGSHLSALRAAGIRPFLIPGPGTAQPGTEGADTAEPWAEAEDLAAQISRLTDPVILNIAGHFVSSHVAADIPTLVAGTPAPRRPPSVP